LELLKPGEGGYSKENYVFPEYNEKYSKEYNKQLLASGGKWKYAADPPDERVEKTNDPSRQEQLVNDK